jgi:hypothetical protein
MNKKKYANRIPTISPKLRPEVYISTIASPLATHCPGLAGVEKRPRLLIRLRTVLKELS